MYHLDITISIKIHIILFEYKMHKDAQTEELNNMTLQKIDRNSNQIVFIENSESSQKIISEDNAPGFIILSS